MLNLKEYIKESILDDEDIVFNNVDIKLEIEKFIKDNYRCKQFTISNKPNKDGKFVVDGSNIQVTNNNIVSSHRRYQESCQSKTNKNIITSHFKAI